jgi:hypothetical protein
MAARFATGWRRFVPLVGYHHVLMILIAIAIVLLGENRFPSCTEGYQETKLTASSPLLALLLAGCSSTSPGIPDIFLISLYYEKYPPVFDPAQVQPAVTTAVANIVGSAQLEVRVGYFGICIQPENGAFLCNQNASALADLVRVDQDPLNLIWVASTFKDSIVFPYLM